MMIYDVVWKCIFESLDFHRPGQTLVLHAPDSAASKAWLHELKETVRRLQEEDSTGNLLLLAEHLRTVRRRGQRRCSFQKEATGLSLGGWCSMSSSCHT